MLKFRAEVTLVQPYGKRGVEPTPQKVKQSAFYVNFPAGTSNGIKKVIYLY